MKVNVVLFLVLNIIAFLKWFYLSVFPPVSYPVPNQPSLVVTPNSAFLQSSTQLALRCSTTSAGTASYQFLRNGLVVSTGSDNVFLIPSPSTQNSGTYTCIVTINQVDSLPSFGHAVTFVGE